MSTAVTREQLIAEYERELARMPTIEQLEAWRPDTLEDAIEKTRLRGTRLATERLLEALRGAPERGKSPIAAGARPKTNT